MSCTTSAFNMEYVTNLYREARAVYRFGAGKGAPDLRVGFATIFGSGTEYGGLFGTFIPDSTTRWA